MACRTIMTGGGYTAIVCGPRARQAPCSVPGCGRPHAKLCDFPVARAGKKSQTCDAKLCADHATAAGPDADLCPPHARRAQQTGGATP